MFSDASNNKAELSTQNTLNPENPAKVSIKRVNSKQAASRDYALDKEPATQ